MHTYFFFPVEELQSDYESESDSNPPNPKGMALNFCCLSILQIYWFMMALNEDWENYVNLEDGGKLNAY